MKEVLTHNPQNFTEPTNKENVYVLEEYIKEKQEDMINYIVGC